MKSPRHKLIDSNLTTTIYRILESSIIPESQKKAGIQSADIRREASLLLP